MITPGQLTQINLLMIDKNECTELLKVEKTESKDKQTLIDLQQDQLQNKDEQLELRKIETSVLSDQNTYLEKELKTQIRKTKTKSILGTICGLASGFVIGYFILK